MLRGVAPLEIDGVRWWLREGADADALAPRLARALAQLESASDLRAGRRKRLFRVALGACDDESHLLKRSGYPAARGWLRGAFGSKARRELAIAQGLAARGVPVVVPLAAGERRRCGRVEECFLLSPVVPDARDLAAWLGAGDHRPSRLRPLAVSLGELIRAAHEAGLHQHDLAPNNVLVCGPAPFSLRLIDFERARLRRRASEGARSRMLAKLARATHLLPVSLRLRFLVAYAGDAAGARRWWQRVRDEAARLARRDDTRLRRSATREGRSFTRFTSGSWSGPARRMPALDAELALTDPAPGPAPAQGGVRVERAPHGWRVIHRRLPPREAGRLFARAHVLAARGLAPHPLACLSDRERTLLALATPAEASPLASCAHAAPARRALARLLAELCALGELSGPLDASLFALVRDPQRGLRAVLLAPHVIRFHGRPSSAAGRAVAARRLADVGRE